MLFRDYDHDDYYDIRNDALEEEWWKRFREYCAENDLDPDNEEVQDEYHHMDKE